MEYLVLGLLILSPMTGYELQQFIKKNLALICSHSAGSVQTALSKLQKDGKVTANETVEGRRHKKTFYITDAGRAAFNIWIAQPMQAEKAKNMELSRLFFAGLAKPEERLAAIQNYISQMEETKVVLGMIRERFRAMKEQELPSRTTGCRFCASRDLPLSMALQLLSLRLAGTASCFVNWRYNHEHSCFERQPQGGKFHHGTYGPVFAGSASGAYLYLCTSGPTN